MYFFLKNHSIFFMCLIIMLGLCIGSFLNVIIYRLPKIIQQSWEENLPNVPIPPKDKIERLNLINPSSHCPYCKKKIPFWLNIPLLGYFLSGRKCQNCQQQISFIYPLVECLTGLASGLVALKWGISWETFGALLFTWLLIPLIFIDLKHQILPDILTLLGIWLGLLFNLLNLFCYIEDAIIGVVVGYSSLWIIAHIFKFIKKQDGIGYGDFKLLAMIGAWQGWADLPFILLQASLFGLIVSTIRLLLKKQTFDTPIAFGPYLALSGWMTLFFNETIMRFYYTFLNWLDTFFS